jgi:hypothetical protein
MNSGASISFANVTTGTGPGIQGTVGDNDYWRFGGGATATNSGYAEIATADDGTEPIYVRQYTGVFTTLARTAVLLDGSGNTSFPGTITAGGGPSIFNGYGGFVNNYAVFAHSSMAGTAGYAIAQSSTGYLWLNCAAGQQVAISNGNGSALFLVSGSAIVANEAVTVNSTINATGNVTAPNFIGLASNSSALGGLASARFVYGDNYSGSNDISGTTFANVGRSGFFVASAPSDGPSGANWAHLINAFGPNWASPGQYGFQISSSFSGGSNLSWGAENYAMRVITGGTAQPWRYLWHSGNLNPGNYLPLVGGTLTGGLTGTTATMSGVICSGYSSGSNANLVGSWNSGGYYGIGGTGILNDYTILLQGVSNLGVANGNNANLKVTGTITSVAAANAVGLQINAAYGSGQIRSWNFSNIAAQVLGIGPSTDPSLIMLTGTLGSGSNAIYLQGFVNANSLVAGNLSLNGPLSIASAGTGCLAVPYGSTTNAPTPVEGQILLVQGGPGSGPVSTYLAVPSGVTWMIKYRTSTGATAWVGAGGTIDFPHLSGFLIGGADGNWHLIHV